MKKNEYVFGISDKTVILIKTTRDFVQVKKEIEKFFELNETKQDVYSTLNDLYRSDFSVKPVNSLDKNLGDDLK